MKRNLLIRSLVVLAVTVVALYYSYPPFDTATKQGRLNLGLDLKGGVNLVWQVDKEKLNQMGMTALMRQDTINRAAEVIRNRIDALGVKEPSVQTQGTDRIQVQLPGLDNPEEAIKTIGGVAYLEFRLVNDDQQKLTEAQNGKVPLGWELKQEITYDDRGNRIENDMLVKAKPALTGEMLQSAYPTASGGFSMPEVGLEFTREGAKRFAKVTGENVGKRLAILLDDKIISAPVIKGRIEGGRAVIQGQFTSEEVQRLSRQLSGGALPVPLVLIDNRSVSPSLGSDSIRSGIYAAIGGSLLVFIFMGVYYLFSGMIANIALFLNLVLITGAMGALGFTLSMPGIAGIVLTIGMAVDANILIFERIREEIEAGKTVHTSIAAGFKRAFLTIFDSNVTTLIAALFLFWFGTGPIKGFAVTLTIGLLANIFTAVFVSRVIFDLISEKTEIKRLRMMKILANPKIDFVRLSKMALTCSLIVIVVGMGYFFYRGKDNFGVDFKGGTVLQIKSEKPLQLDQVRATLKEVGESQAVLQYYGNTKNSVLIKSSYGSADNIFNVLKQNFADAGITRERTEYVGPAVGAELRQQAFLAVLFSLVAILIYVTARFEFRFALGGIIALFHDVLVTVGLYALSGREISLQTIAAILTIVGYSINDTIVIFDRVRENMGIYKKLDLPSLINLSVNQTLARTILTSFTAFLATLALYLFGGEVVNDFAFIMLIGIVTGSYSTIYIASPIVLLMEKKPKNA